ncbi:MAG: hypothetical protein LC746_06340, partial [Acidobacteria bacterium]|nr:hypothetical protein [Acidobacteriota bacterium]
MSSLETELDDVLRRLASLDAAAPASEDRDAAERALASYLALHNTPRHPVRWVTDAHDAFRLVAACYEDAQASRNELFRAQDDLDVLLRTKGGRATEAQVESAPVAALDGSLTGVWNFVRQLVQGHDVILSVPWALYHPQFTPNRGRRLTIYGYDVWYNANNVVELVASSAREFRWWRADTPLQRATCKLRLRVTRNLLDAYEAGLWQFWVTRTQTIALPRPALVLRDGRLHCETAPAVSWRASDQRYFCLNGVRVSEEIATTPAARLDPRLILSERNAEVRREIIRKIGIERVCAELNARCVDAQGDYELLLLDLQDGRVRPFLKMRNPSAPGVYHIEG